MSHLQKTALLVLGIGLIPLGCGEKSSGPATKSGASTDPVVTFALPSFMEVADSEEFPGRIETMNSIEVRARVSGYLDKVHFKDGDEVAAGDLLFEIDDRTYKAETNRSESLVAMSVAHAKRLDAEYKRAGNLYARGALSREEYDKIASDHVEAEASVGVAQATFEMAKLNMDFTKVTAPITGRLSRRLIDPGNLVKADDTSLISIVSLDPMYVSFDIDERTMLKLGRLINEGKIKSRVDDNLKVMVGLADESLDYPREATINFSDNRIDPGTGTLRLRGIIANPKPRVLAPGMFARIKLPIGAPRKALMVPELAVNTSQDKKYVYVIDPENKIVEKKITPGLKKDLMVSVEDNPPVINPDDKIIISGLQRIRGGMIVEEKAGVLRAKPAVKGTKEKTKPSPADKIANR